MPKAEPKPSTRPAARSDAGRNGTSPSAVPQKDDSARELARVRALARKQGLRILRAKAGTLSTGPAYELIDGDVVVATSNELEDLRNILSHPPDAESGATNGTVRAAKAAGRGQPVADKEPGRPGSDALEPPLDDDAPSGAGPTAPPATVQAPSSSRSPRTRPSGPACPRCGTLRTGSFRFCRACGMDFEPAHSAASGSLAGPVEPVVRPVAAVATPAEPVMTSREPPGLAAAADFGRISRRVTQRIGRGPNLGSSPLKPTVVSTAPASGQSRESRLPSALIVIAGLIVAVIVGAMVPLVLSMLLR